MPPSYDIGIREFEVDRDVDDLVRLWDDPDFPDNRIGVRDMRAHMLDMSHGFETDGMHLVAEMDGRTVAIGWLGASGTSMMPGKPFVRVLGVELTHSEDNLFYDSVMEKMLAFARRRIRGDANIGKLSDHGDLNSGA